MGKNGNFWRVNHHKSCFLSFSEKHVVGTLNLYLRMPDSMQKESAQSIHPALRKRPKTDDLTDIQNMSTFWQIMDVFSALSYPIELIPFHWVHLYHFGTKVKFFLRVCHLLDVSKMSPGLRKKSNILFYPPPNWYSCVRGNLVPSHLQCTISKEKDKYLQGVSKVWRWPPKTKMKKNNDDLNKIEDDLKKKMEDDLKKNGKKPQQYFF
jgi:hypothetical protein